MKIVFRPDGTIVCTYQEAVDLSACGRAHHQRASHVEPTDSDEWLVDLSPIGGPKLGPFQQRSAALMEESSWLDAHLEEIAGRIR